MTWMVWNENHTHTKQKNKNKNKKMKWLKNPHQKSSILNQEYFSCSANIKLMPEDKEEEEKNGNSKGQKATKLCLFFLISGIESNDGISKTASCQKW